MHHRALFLHFVSCGKSYDGILSQLQLEIKVDTTAHYSWSTLSIKRWRVLSLSFRGFSCPLNRSRHTRNSKIIFVWIYENRVEAGLFLGNRLDSVHKYGHVVLRILSTFCTLNRSFKMPMQAFEIAAK